jgi:hypothetical protein
LKNLENKQRIIINTSLVSLTKDEVMVEYSGLTGNHQLELYDLTGRLLFEKTIGDNTGIIEIATSNYPSGVYVVVLRNAQGIQNQHRLVVE